MTVTDSYEGAPEGSAMADADHAAVETTEVSMEEAAERLRPSFRRAAAHRHGRAYLHGLLGGAERMNGWQLAEYADYLRPRPIQRVLDRSVW